MEYKYKNVRKNGYNAQSSMVDVLLTNIENIAFPAYDQLFDS